MEIYGIDEIENLNTPIDDIETEVINLIFVSIDESGSMSPFAGDMRNNLIDFQGSLLESKDVDEILLARANFSSSITVGGYKPVDQFDVGYDAWGSTVLYDVIVDGTAKLLQYMDYLKKQGMRVKAVFSVFSDGEDTASRASVNEAKKCIEDLQSQEITTAFICFGSGAENEAKKLKFNNILKVGNSNQTTEELRSELRKAFNTLSKSVIDSSKSATPTTDDFFSL